MQAHESDALRDRLRAVLRGRFEIGALVGTGGYAAVFRAEDPLLRRAVAIKVLDPTRVAGADADRFLAEARTVATIEHPHIVPLYEAGREGDIAYLAMRFFPEGSLTGRLERAGRLSPAEVVRLGIEVAEALEAAHQRGVVHLDIKPDNILLDGDGNAAVTDFGIAQLIGARGDDEPMAPSGTPHYMSPEHVAGDVVDGRADVYALGVVLYEAATGRPPITGDSAQQVMANQVARSPQPIASLAPELPTALARVITRALAKDPAERWASAGAMAQALRAAGDADRLLAPREVRKRTRRRWYRRTVVLLGLLGAGLALAIAAAIGLWRIATSGDRPALDAMAPLIPAGVLDSVTALGLLGGADTALYVFVPAGAGLDEALVVTTREIVHRARGGVRRWSLATDYAYRFNISNAGGWLTITDPGTAAVDTLYGTLSGREVGTLRDAITRLVARR